MIAMGGLETMATMAKVGGRVPGNGAGGVKAGRTFAGSGGVE
ncbi:hypothetical protein FRUB_00616 [Fimbriiglobus ruber]|uniref:Uncharacterized protein n=1 Tax=Fimbriiglobus ruber TaxID=1908690 RepID=A0A225EF96_9BACT|nr:hypothetical protein FRUB_00616 [Fimbriiglobus ruber]